MELWAQRKVGIAMRRTPFGSMLANFRFQKQQLIQKTVNAMLKKHNATGKYGSLTEDFEVRESAVHAQDGSTVVKVELWKRIEVERVKISTSVNAELLTEDTKVEGQKDDGNWLD